MVDRSYEKNGNRITENRLGLSLFKVRVGMMHHFMGEYTNKMGEENYASLFLFIRNYSSILNK